MYEVVLELRETISKLQEKVAAQEDIITKLKNGGDRKGSGGGGGLSFAEILKGKASVASSAVVFIMANENKQNENRDKNKTLR
jgi:hypothetical protein